MLHFYDTSVGGMPVPPRLARSGSGPKKVVLNGGPQSLAVCSVHSSYQAVSTPLDGTRMLVLKHLNPQVLLLLCTQLPILSYVRSLFTPITELALHIYLPQLSKPSAKHSTTCFYQLLGWFQLSEFGWAISEFLKCLKRKKG